MFLPLAEVKRRHGVFYVSAAGQHEDQAGWLWLMEPAPQPEPLPQPELDPRGSRGLSVAYDA